VLFICKWFMLDIIQFVGLRWWRWGYFLAGALTELCYQAQNDSVLCLITFVRGKNAWSFPFMPVPHVGMMLCLWREVTYMSEYQVLCLSVEVLSCSVCLDQK
jgi:hypothetical protein